MKRFGLVVLWFALQFVWNLITKQAPDPDGGMVYRSLVAVSQMSSPVELIATIIAMVAIWKRVWQRKSLAERQQAKAEAEDITSPDEPETR
jgi:hypothetical protein